MVNNWCNFVFIEDRWECPLCGTTIVVSDDYEDPPIWPCVGPQLDSKDLAKDITNFFNLTSNTNDISDENTIAYRHSICNSCELFINNTCSECGCSITRDRNYLNKLAIRSESCPKSKW